MSEIRADKLHNASGDNDSGIDLSTNDQVDIKIADSVKARVDSSGNVSLGTTSITTGTLGSSNKFLEVAAGTASGSGTLVLSRDTSANGVEMGAVRFVNANNATDGSNDNSGKLVGVVGCRTVTTDTNAGDDSGGDLVFSTKPETGTLAERMRILSDGNISIAKTTANNTTEGTSFFGTDGMSIVRSAGTCQVINRLTNDGVLVSFRQASGDEGNISVSGSTISYNGFSGLHESSGIATDTPIGTVVSTIDELDVYFAKQGEGDSEEDNPKSGQTRADHAKVKVSDTEGDKAVYGVVGSFNTQGKVNVASVGIGSVRVTGACEKGDLLESNGDGTAKVQSDDIVRSKTIGKVTIGNSSTDVKLVSCVLYCG